MLIKNLLLLALINYVANFSIEQNVNYYELQSENYHYKRALEKSHEKPLAEKWMDKFYGRKYKSEEVHSIIKLIYVIVSKYLNKCIPIVLYEKKLQTNNYLIFKQIFQRFPISVIHGEIDDNFKVVEPELLEKIPGSCRSYIVFLSDVMNSRLVLKKQSSEMVLVVSWSSQWRVQEFLSNEVSQRYVNLLVLGQSLEQTRRSENTFILYTHRLYVDGLGSSTPVILTSWYNNSFTRPSVNLFPPKMKHGFAGHRFIVGISDQPPYVIKRQLSDKDGSNSRVQWDGIEIRMVKLLSHMLNFTLEWKEVTPFHLSPGDAVIKDVIAGKSDMGVAGLYVTNERIASLDLSHGHSQDCASFISLTSTALPRYRAIMGPFHWTVWVALTITYLIAILPLAFSDRQTFRHLIDNPGEIENMFWYVFGTFTNCFTFSGVLSWSKSNKITTRLLVGWYWAFTIIITACYTGSIIAFVTLPVYPSTIDSSSQLLSFRYRIGTLDRGGWEHWFVNSSDDTTKKLMKNIELLPDVQSGIRNVTKAFFWSYAFLGSRANLDYIVRTNFTQITNKRSLLHISKECFVPYMVGFALPIGSMYITEVNIALLRLVQSGFTKKIASDVEWEMYRSATGKLLQVNTGQSLKGPRPDDKALSLADTQGMFLLLGLGFIVAAGSLFSEYVGGCYNYCKGKKFFKRRQSSISTTSKSFHVGTPRNFNLDTEYVQCNNESLEWSDTTSVNTDSLMQNEDRKDITDSTELLIHTQKENLDVNHISSIDEANRIDLHKNENKNITAESSENMLNDNQSETDTKINDKNVENIEQVMRNVHFDSKVTYNDGSADITEESNVPEYCSENSKDFEEKSADDMNDNRKLSKDSSCSIDYIKEIDICFSEEKLFGEENIIVESKQEEIQSE